MNLVSALGRLSEPRCGRCHEATLGSRCVSLAANHCRAGVDELRLLGEFFDDPWLFLSDVEQTHLASLSGQALLSCAGARSRGGVRSAGRHTRLLFVWLSAEAFGAQGRTW